MDRAILQMFRGDNSLTSRAVEAAGVSGTNGSQSSAKPPRIEFFHTKDTKTFLLDLAFGTAMMGVFYFVFKQIVKQMDPTSQDAQSSSERHALLSSLGKLKVEKNLNEYECVILSDVILPDDIKVKFDDIGGLASTKQQIIDTILLPLKKPHLFRRKNAQESQHKSLVTPPRGVLFYGCPGTGKTLLAKAIANASGAAFINLRISAIVNKYYGESQKLCRAVFTLARKLAPAIIFIDEIDSFLGHRGGHNENESSNMVKAEFLSMWDGLTTDDEKGHVVVLGATNRPWDLDEAFSRRMPRTFEFHLPDVDERFSILKVLLHDHQVLKSVDLKVLASMTNSYSGSDLKEVCRYAAMIPLREVMREHQIHLSSEEETKDDDAFDPRPLAFRDFVEALNNIKPTGQAAKEYLSKQDLGTNLSEAFNAIQRGHGAGVDSTD